MSRGEETDEPIAGDDHAVSGEPVDLSEPESAGEPSGPPPRHAVVISGDGSAAIDGEPVRPAEGESVDAAILDRLHAYARDRNTTVTATISDPAARYMAFVEVAADGSSSLLEQQPEPAEGPGPALPPPGHAEPAEHAVRAEPYSPVAEACPSGPDDDLDDDDGGDGYHAPPPSAARPIPRVAPGNGSRQSDDEHKSPGLFHKPLAVGPVALGVAALVIVPLVILGSGSPDGGGRQKEAARSTTEVSRTPRVEETVPTVSSTANTLPTVTATSPSAKPKAPKRAKAPKSGRRAGKAVVTAKPPRATVTAKPPRATVTAKPPRVTAAAKPAQDTAATAVNRLHRNDPSGRHICYRAYLTGQGWQKPVCDGTLAGTTSGTHPIQALNIAVYGVGGSAANAFVHDPGSTSGQGKWEPYWTDKIGDGKNNYIGSAKSGAPYMAGFAINVGTGRICRTAKVRSSDWGAAACTDPSTGYVFGGTLDNTRWLAAVKLWV